MCDIMEVDITEPRMYSSQAYANSLIFSHKKKKKKTLHMLTHDAMQRCGLTSLIVYINEIFCDRCDKKEWDLNHKHPFPRFSGH